MAVEFDGTTECYYRTTSPVTAIPATCSVFFRPTDVAGSREGHIYGLYRQGFSDSLRLFQFGDFPSWSVYDGTAFVDVNASAATFSANTWYHLLGRSSSTTDHELFVNGVSASTSTTSSNPTLDDIGASGVFTGAIESLVEGQQALGGIWDVALNDNEASMLAAGVPPIRVRRQNLQAFHPMLNTAWGGNDLSGLGIDLDNTGGTPIDYAGNPGRSWFFGSSHALTSPVAGAKAPQLMMMGVGN